MMSQIVCHLYHEIQLKKLMHKLALIPRQLPTQISTQNPTQHPMQEVNTGIQRNGFVYKSVDKCTDAYNTQRRMWYFNAGRDNSTQKFHCRNSTMMILWEPLFDDCVDINILIIFDDFGIEITNSVFSTLQANYYEK